MKLNTKKILLEVGCLVALFCYFPFAAVAQSDFLFEESNGSFIASDSAEATKSSDLASASSSSIVKRVVEKKPDITEPNPEIKGKLESYLEENPPGPLSLFNFVQYSIRYAVGQGVPANTIVLILMFPLIATMVVISRHIVGLKSFGIFTPALLSVAFLNTGVLIGSFLFILILLVATIFRVLFKRIRIQYLPRMAVLLWFVSMAIFVSLIISPTIGREELITIGIFPLLILVLLVEDFLDLQITRNFSQALRVTIETLAVALLCFMVMSLEPLQKVVLINPEGFTLSILFVIWMVDRYSGLRLLEIWRFRKMLQ